jgi:hypothetical protein
MKQVLLLCCISGILFSCGSSDPVKAVRDAKQVQSELKKIQPGGIPVSTGGWTMTAKIGGKDWAASSIMSPDVAGRIAGEGDDQTISLPYDRRSMVVGDKTSFSHNNAVDLMTNDDVGLWGGYKGEMEITKVDDNWAEGKFFFTGSSDDKTIEVTEGFFRISMAIKK